LTLPLFDTLFQKKNGKSHVFNSFDAVVDKSRHLGVWCGDVTFASKNCRQNHSSAY